MEEEHEKMGYRTRLLPSQAYRQDVSASAICWAKLKESFQCKTVWSEISGSLGDLGTFVPIVIALTLVNGLDLSTTLIFTGIYNIVTGWLWGVPMPVQPMKSIAAVAISEGEHLTVPEIMAAGICTAGTLFVLGVTGLMGLFYRLIPLPVVRGVQLSQGLSFAFTAVKYVRKQQSFGSNKSEGDRPWLGWDGILLALLCFCFIVLVTGSGDGSSVEDEEAERGSHQRISTTDPRMLPSALIVFMAGLLIGIGREPQIVKQLKLGPSKLNVIGISGNDWKTGFIRASIPQIPLSVLNSVIAVCKLSADLFPHKEVSATSVSVSVGIMNLVGCWFGAMPVCHGAGGLAGQYRFGGRSGTSVAFLGTLKMALGLLLGSSLVKILTLFPIGLLGVLLLFSGIELAMASRDMDSKSDSFVMLVCTAISLTGSSAALGFGCGIALYLLLKLREMDYHECIDLFPTLFGRRMSSQTGSY